MGRIDIYVYIHIPSDHLIDIFTLLKVFRFVYSSAFFHIDTTFDTEALKILVGIATLYVP